MYNDDDDITQRDGYSTANRLPETCCLGLQHLSLIMGIHVMVI